VREKIKTKPPDAISSVNTKVHKLTEGLCLRCLKKQQGKRFTNPRALVENIDKVFPLVCGGETKKSVGRLQRRVAAASRKRSGGGNAKSAQGKKKAPTRRNPPSGRGKTKSAVGKVPRVRPSGAGPVRQRGGRAAPAPRGGNSSLLVVALVGVGVVFLLGLLLILASN
jgi:hypothetical protein